MCDYARRQMRCDVINAQGTGGVQQTQRLDLDVGSSRAGAETKARLMGPVKARARQVELLPSPPLSTVAAPFPRDLNPTSGASQTCVVQHSYLRRQAAPLPRVPGLYSPGPLVPCPPQSRRTASACRTRNQAISTATLQLTRAATASPCRTLQTGDSCIAGNLGLARSRFSWPPSECAATVECCRCPHPLASAIRPAASGYMVT